MGKFKPSVEIPKNVKLTEEYVESHRENIIDMMEWFLNYPDIYIDMITPSYSNFQLYFYQRIFLRACMRYRYHYCVAPRAFSKSFISILAGYLRCMFLPNSKYFICAPGKEQGAKIAKEKFDELFQKFPMLKNEYVKYNASKDYVTIVFKNDSVFDVVGALDSTRGGRRNGGIIDEIRDHDGTTLTEIVLPLMNVDRRDAQGDVDPTEPNQQQVMITSAGTKGTYAYEKLIETFIQSIIAPESAFVWGCDYRVPMMHGLLNRKFIQELKLSGTYQADSFAREYLSIWTGGSSDSWINYDKMDKYRTIVNPEKTSKLQAGDKSYYYISVDVARKGVNTSVQIFKVLPQETRFLKKLVNSLTFHDMHFQLQAIELKKLYQRYHPKEMCIDGTGLGVGLMDFMVIDQLGEDGVMYPALSCINDEDYKKYSGPKVIYLLKANATENSLIHSNCYTQIANGSVRFLISEQEAKVKLLGTKKGQKMKPAERLVRLAPHIETTRLFEEICNLKVKNTGTNTVVEQISSKINKDRFSAFEYALWRIKADEDEYFRKKRYKNRSLSKFMLFTKK